MALAAGVDLKVASAMLRHSSITITADIYISVLPETARAAAEAAASVVPRRGAFRQARLTRRIAWIGVAAPTIAMSEAVEEFDWFGVRRGVTARGRDLENDSGPLPVKVKGQVRKGAPPGTRTPDPR